MKANKTAKILAISAIVVVVLITGAFVALRLMFPSEKIKALIIPHVEKALGRKVTVENARISILPFLGATISGAQISNTERTGFSNEPFVKIGKFQIQISIMSLLKRSPEISRILIQRPHIRIEIDSAGSYNYEDIAALRTEPGQKKDPAKKGLPMLPVPLTLRQFAIQDGIVVYDNKKAAQQIVIGDLDDVIKFSIDRGLKDIKTSGTLVLSSVSVRTKEITKPLSDLKITFSHDIGADLVGGTAQINEIRLSLQKVFLTMKGTATGLNDTPNLDLHIASDPIAIGDLLSEVPVELAPIVAKLAAKGTAELGLTIKGALTEGTSVPIAGNLGLKDVNITYAGMPKSLNNLNADIDFTDNSLSVNNLTMRLGENPFEIKAKIVNFKKPLLDLALKGKLDLSDVKEMMELPKDATLAGMVALDITAAGEADPADPSKLDFKGKVDFSELVVLWSPLLKPAHINGAFNLSSTAIGENLKVKIGESNLVMAADIKNYLSLVFTDSTKKLPRPSVDFKLTSQMLNIDEILKPADTTKTGQESGAAASSGPMIAPLPGVDMKGTIAAQKIIYKGINMSGLQARISVVNDVADFDFQTGFGGGSIRNKLHADLRNVQRISFTDDLTVDRVEVNDLMESFGSNLIKPTTALNRELRQIQNNLFGKVALKASFAGSGGSSDEITENLIGDISLGMSEGKIVNSPLGKNISSAISGFIKKEKAGAYDNITFNNLSAQIKLAAGRALIENLKMQSDVGDWNASGSIGFDALMDIVVSNKLTKAFSAQLLAAEDAGKNVAKGLLKGTQLAGVASMFDAVNMIPRDADSRVTIKLGLTGPVSNPKPSSIAFGEGATGSSGQQQPTAKQQIQERVQQTIDQKKDEVAARLAEERQKAEAELRSKAEEQRAILEQQKKQQQEELMKKVPDKLKKLF